MAAVTGQLRQKERLRVRIVPDLPDLLLDGMGRALGQKEYASLETRFCCKITLPIEKNKFTFGSKDGQVLASDMGGILPEGFTADTLPGLQVKAGQIPVIDGLHAGAKPEGNLLASFGRYREIRHHAGEGVFLAALFHYRTADHRAV